jgi:hypothetical protein
MTGLIRSAAPPSRRGHVGDQRSGWGLAQHRGHGKAPLDIFKDVGGQPLGSGRS